MADTLQSYEAGLTRLLEHLGSGHPRYAEALTLQARLLENITQAGRYGDTETRRAERAQIVEALNRLALEAVRVSFNRLCEAVPTQPGEAQPTPPKEIGCVGRIGSWIVGLRVWYRSLPAKTQATVTVAIVTALIGLFGTLGAPVVGELAERLLARPNPTEVATLTPTNTPTPTYTSLPTLLATPRETPTDTLTTTLTHTPTNTPTHTPTNTPTHTPTNTLTHTPTNTPTDTPTSTATNTPRPTTPRPQAVKPELISPTGDMWVERSVTFQWQGSLRSGQTYQVVATHVESGYSTETTTTDTSWTTGLPADKDGKWVWSVSVLQGSSVVETSVQESFNFAPSGSGEGGEHDGPSPTPPKEHVTPAP
jgi:hypothetical protein